MPFKNPINSAWVDFRDNVFEYHEGELTMPISSPKAPAGAPTSKS